MASILPQSPMDFYAPTQQRKQFSATQLSDLSIYDSQSLSDSTGSPTSPIYPFIPGAYQLPVSDWMTWEDKGALSPELGSYGTTDSYGSPFVPDFSDRTLSLSPSVNPMDLTNSLPESFDFNQDNLGSPVTFSPLSQPSPPTTVRKQRKAKHVSSPTSDESTRQTRKRKSYGSVAVSPRSSTSPSPRASVAEQDLPQKKAAHNMIEKRYRTNLNDKIAALRDSVPALRVMANRTEREDEDLPLDDDMNAEELGGLTPAHKLNKATILSKATEYIAHLERRNKSLATENEMLKSKVDGFQIITMGQQGVEPQYWQQ